MADEALCSTVLRRAYSTFTGLGRRIPRGSADTTQSASSSCQRHPLDDFGRIDPQAPAVLPRPAQHGPPPVRLAGTRHAPMRNGDALTQMTFACRQVQRATTRRRQEYLVGLDGEGLGDARGFARGCTGASDFARSIGSSSTS